MTEHRKAARKLTDPAAKQKLYLRISKEAKTFTDPLAEMISKKRVQPAD